MHACEKRNWQFTVWRKVMKETPAVMPNKVVSMQASRSFHGQEGKEKT